MWRSCLALMLILPLFIDGATLDRKIQSSKKRLASTRSAYANMDKKLGEIAHKIEENQKSLERLDKIIEKSEKEIAVNSVILKEGRKRLSEIEQEILRLDKIRRSQKKELIDLLANRYILQKIKQEKGIQSTDDVIASEVIAALIQKENERIKDLQRSYLTTVKKGEELKKEAKRIEEMLQRLQKRKERAAKEKERRKALVVKLQKEKKAYQARLERLQKEEADLRNTLAKLSIIKQKRIEEARQKKVGMDKRIIARGDKLKVRTIGSSYQRHAIGSYRGPKTISPVGRAKVVKKFGSYIDPIYKIKIFNESVTLQPYKHHAKVKNVLNGKVVFAKETAMLGKVVIVEHGNALHTIYAKMDKIAPTIKEGKKVRKGYVIGRVEKELMFEVTKRNRHIDPLQLIKLR